MKIAFLVLTQRYVVGGVLSVIDAANALHRRGHEVHVGIIGVQSADESAITSLDEVPWIQLEEGVHAHFVDEGSRPESPDIAIGFSSPGSLTVGFRRGVAAQDAFDHPWPMVCVSRWLRDLAVEQGVAERRLIYIPEGLDHETFRVTAPIGDRPPQVAMLYNDYPGKRVADGLAAIAEVRRDRPEVQAVLFGTQDPVDDLPGWVRYYKDPDRRTLVEDIYNASRVFVCPSVSEGFGRPSLEAMASGCALVTVDNGGSREFAIDGRTALVTPPKDVTAMATAVARLIDDDDYRAALATRGVEHSQRFDWDVNAAQLETFFEDYIADPARYVEGDIWRQAVRR